VSYSSPIQIFKIRC